MNGFLPFGPDGFPDLHSLRVFTPPCASFIFVPFCNHTHVGSIQSRQVSPFGILRTGRAFFFCWTFGRTEEDPRLASLLLFFFLSFLLSLASIPVICCWNIVPFFFLSYVIDAVSVVFSYVPLLYSPGGCRTLKSLIFVILRELY